MSTAATTRRLRHREEAQRTILDATEALLLEDGYEGFSMRRLAQRCGYAAPTIYHYFGDKPGLIDALLEERFADFLREILRVESAVDPADYMCALARCFVEWGMRNPTFSQLLALPRPDDKEPPRSAQEARAVFEEPLHRLAGDGRLYVEDAEVVKQTVWALLHGLVNLRLIHPEEPWSDDLVDVALEAMLRGTVRPKPAAAPSGEAS